MVHVISKETASVMKGMLVNSATAVQMAILGFLTVEVSQIRTEVKNTRICLLLLKFVKLRLIQPFVFICVLFRANIFTYVFVSVSFSPTTNYFHKNKRDISVTI